jgi:hypothetical protein
LGKYSHKKIAKYFFGAKFSQYFLGEKPQNLSNRVPKELFSKLAKPKTRTPNLAETEYELQK